MIVGALLVVVVVLFVIVFLNLEGIVNRNKDFFLTQAETKLGREVSVEKIGVTLRGGIGVRLENFAIADDPAFSSEPFVKAKGLQVNAKILPLLKKRFEIKRVILRDPVIRIIRDEDGNLNTSTFGVARAAASGPDTSTSTPAEPPVASSSGAAPLVVSLIDIDGGELHVVDKGQGLDLRLTQIESKVEELNLEKPISLRASAAFLSDKPNINISGKFGPIGQEVGTETLSVEASVEIDPIDIATLAKTLPAIKEAMPPGLEIAGPLSVMADANGTPSAMDLILRIDATQAAVNMPQAFRKTAGTPLAVASEVSLTQQKVTIKNFDLNFHTLEATGKGEYRIETPPSISLSVDSKPTSLAEWTEMVPAMKPYGLSGTVEFSARVDGALRPGQLPDISGTAALADAGASVPQLIKPISQGRSEITFTAQQATIKNASLMLGNSRIDASATVESFEPLTVSYRANSPALALDDVRPPNPKVKKREVLENVVVEGRMVADKTPTNRGAITASSGSIGNIDFQNLEADYAVVGKETRLDGLNVETLDGAISGSGVITMNDDVPTFDIKTEARDLNVIALFDKLPNVTRQFLRGKANMSLNFSGTGKEWPDIQKTISGQGLAELFEGAVIDFSREKPQSQRRRVQCERTGCGWF
jgi:uncharacterized protein involved in outer membrane biogenesis